LRILARVGAVDVIDIGQVQDDGRAEARGQERRAVVGRPARFPAGGDQHRFAEARRRQRVLDDGHVRHLLEDRPKQVRVQPRRVDADPIDVLARDASDGFGRLLVLPCRRAPAADQNEALSLGDALRDEGLEFFEERDIDPALGDDQRASERDDDRRFLHFWLKFLGRLFLLSEICPRKELGVRYPGPLRLPPKLRELFLLIYLSLVISKRAMFST
jgi:hypothetical protein